MYTHAATRPDRDVCAYPQRAFPEVPTDESQKEILASSSQWHLPNNPYQNGPTLQKWKSATCCSRLAHGWFTEWDASQFQPAMLYKITPFQQGHTTQHWRQLCAVPDIHMEGLQNKVLASDSLLAHPYQKGPMAQNWRSATWCSRRIYGSPIRWDSSQFQPVTLYKAIPYRKRPRKQSWRSARCCSRSASTWFTKWDNSQLQAVMLHKAITYQMVLRWKTENLQHALSGVSTDGHKMRF